MFPRRVSRRKWAEQGETGSSPAALCTTTAPGPVNGERGQLPGVCMEICSGKNTYVKQQNTHWTPGFPKFLAEKKRCRSRNREYHRRKNIFFLANKGKDLTRNTWWITVAPADQIQPANLWECLVEFCTEVGCIQVLNRQPLVLLVFRFSRIFPMGLPNGSSGGFRRHPCRSRTG
jgi:hypothetical protein